MRRVELATSLPYRVVFSIGIDRAEAGVVGFDVRSEPVGAGSAGYREFRVFAEGLRRWCGLRSLRIYFSHSGRDLR